MTGICRFLPFAQSDNIKIAVGHHPTQFLKVKTGTSLRLFKNICDGILLPLFINYGLEVMSFKEA